MRLQVHVMSCVYFFWTRAHACWKYLKMMVGLDLLGDNDTKFKIPGTKKYCCNLIAKQNHNKKASIRANFWKHIKNTSSRFNITWSNNPAWNNPWMRFVSLLPIMVCDLIGELYIAIIAIIYMLFSSFSINNGAKTSWPVLTVRNLLMACYVARAMPEPLTRWRRNEKSKTWTRKSAGGDPFWCWKNLQKVYQFVGETSPVQ